MRYRFQIVLSLSLVLLTCVHAGLAQPAMSRGQQILSIGYDECLQRAQAAFSAEGWVNVGTSGNAVNGFKGISGSYIVCNPAVDNKMAVNIFVTSSSNDSGVPGAERVRLQGRMDQTAQQPPPPQLSSIVRTQKQVYGQTEQIVVEFNSFPGNKTDWITIATVGEADNNYRSWQYTDGKTSGTVTFNALYPGEYEVRAFFNWDKGGYTVHGRHRFTVR